MNKLYWVILSVLVALGITVGMYIVIGRAPASEILATVDGEHITTQEFLHRYWEYLKITGIKDNLATRHIIMRNMLNERLMKHDARRRGWMNSSEYKHQVEDATIQVLLDTYRGRAIHDTVQVGEDEVQRAFARSRTKMSVRHLYARTEDEALRLKARLDNGESFETLAREVFRDPRLAASGGYLGFIGAGDTDPAFEDAAFSLPVGSVSGPVRTAHGFSIIRVDKKMQLPLADQYDFELQRKRITMELRQRKIVQQDMRFAKTLVDGGQVKMNDPLVARLFADWKSLDTTVAIERLGDSIRRQNGAGDQPLLQYGATAWTMQDFLNKLTFTTARQRAYVQTESDLREFIIGLLTRDLVVERAKAAGLENEPGVRSQINMRVDNYVFNRWRNLASDSVRYDPVMPAGLSDAEQADWTWRHNAQEKVFRAHFDKKTEIYRFPDEVRVSEIYCLTNADAVGILKQCVAGNDFAALARKYSKRTWAAAKGGDMGYHSREEYGMLGDKIFDAKAGTIIGPVPVDSGYSIIRVLDRRPGREKTYEEAKDDIYQELLRGWRDIAFTRALQALERTSTVVYDTTRLESIPFIDPMMLVQGE